MWSVIAFVARFGNQPISEIQALTYREVLLLKEALLQLIEKSPALRLG